MSPFRIGEQAGLDDHDAGLAALEELGEACAVGGEGVEACVLGAAGVEAGDALVFAEVEGANGAGGGWGRGGPDKLLWGAGGLGIVILSVYHAPRLPQELPSSPMRWHPLLRRVFSSTVQTPP